MSNGEPVMTATNPCRCRQCMPVIDGMRADIYPYRNEVMATPIEAHVVPPPAEPEWSETILEEAQRLVHGNRGADYGHPIDDYKATGRKWGATLERWLKSIGFPLPPEGFPDIDPRICTLMMGDMKISREAGKHKRDNLTDLAGYAECAAMVADRQAESNNEAQ